MLDNNYVIGSSTPISRTDANGNTYQARPLQDGSTHEVLKNFPSQAELKQSGMAHRFNVETDTDLQLQIQHYWYAAMRNTRM